MSFASKHTIHTSHVQSITISLIQLAAFRFPFIPSHDPTSLSTCRHVEKFCWKAKLFFMLQGATRDLVTQPILLTRCENIVPGVILLHFSRFKRCDSWFCALGWQGAFNLCKFDSNARLSLKNDTFLWDFLKIYLLQIFFLVHILIISGLSQIT